MPTTNDSNILEVLRFLGVRQQVSQRQVARSLGMSLGSVNYCLRALMARGLVKAENYRKSDNKLAYFYLLTPAGFSAKADLTQRFLALKLQEYDALRQEIEQLKHEVEAAP